MVVFGPKSGFRRATGPPRGCNGHAVMLQRGRHCKAIAAPLQSNKALTGSPSSPFGGVRGGRLFISDCVTVICKKQWFFDRKNREILSFVRFENLEAWPKNFQKCPGILPLNSEFCGQTAPTQNHRSIVTRLDKSNRNGILNTFLQKETKFFIKFLARTVTNAYLCHRT